MSYIRSGSNPEKLYIWGNGVNVFISKGHEETKVIPKNIFHGLIRKWFRNEWEDSSFKGASVKEVLGEINNEKQHQIELSYSGWSIYMWLVTWVYITHTNLSNINNGAKKIVIK